MQIFAVRHISATVQLQRKVMNAFFQFFLTDKTLNYDKKEKKKKSHKQIGGLTLLHENIYADLQQIKLKVQEAA